MKNWKQHILEKGVWSLTLCFSLCAHASFGPDNIQSVPTSRVSLGGAVFTLDTNHPKLGSEVYYSESQSLSWGDLAMEGNEIRRMTKKEAEDYCGRHEGRLPKVAELRQLRDDLSSRENLQYSPYENDGVTPVLPHLPEFRYIWSADGSGSPAYSYAFDTIFGTLDSGHPIDKPYAVRCVAN